METEKTSKANKNDKMSIDFFYEVTVMILCIDLKKTGLNDFYNFIRTSKIIMLTE